MMGAVVVVFFKETKKAQELFFFFQSRSRACGHVVKKRSTPDPRASSSVCPLKPSAFLLDTGVMGERL